jgi:hypothetical protein
VSSLQAFVLFATLRRGFCGEEGSEFVIEESKVTIADCKSRGSLGA